MKQEEKNEAVSNGCVAAIFSLFAITGIITLIGVEYEKAWFLIALSPALASVVLFLHLMFFENRD